MRVKFYSLDYMVYVKRMREEEEERMEMGEMEQMERLSHQELRMMYASELKLNG